MADREQVDATWKEYCDASKPTGVVHGTDVEEFDVDEMDRAAWELHQLNLTLLRERDAAEALAYERAAECADAQAWAPSKEYSDDEAEHIADLIRALTPSPNALAEHDAKVRAEERERVIDHLVIFLGHASDDGDKTRGRVLQEIIDDLREGRHAENMITSAIREQAND